MKLPPGGPVQDLTGKYVIPGMINLHGHVSIVSSLGQDAKGFYTPDQAAHRHG
jgi:cytosine/adenosine deaminase-related metal-dependent hydrolase